MKKIAAVVIFYNPDVKALNNLKSYINNIDKLYAIDNSDLILNSLFKKKLAAINKVVYIQNKSNLGIGVAINIGVKRAIEDGYEYLLTMDQDSYFEKDALKILFNFIERFPTAGILSPYHKNKFFTNPPKNMEYEEILDVMTSGNLLNLSVVQKVGYFNEEYFIDYVDIEYCLRLKENGFSIIRVNNSILKHNEANISKKTIFGSIIYPTNHAPTRWYYKMRNFFYLQGKYKKSFSEYFINEKINIRNNILKVLLFESQRMKKIKMMIKGYIDFKKNVRGKLFS